jgi:hypothetical protein
MSNALKYAFPRGVDGHCANGLEIRIELRVQADEPLSTVHRLTLIVGDNGVGFPARVDFRNTTTLGLQLVNQLVNQLEGTVELHQNGGTEFRIEYRAAIAPKKSEK